MLEGFKKFILRGNVVDLAVGVVIGAAFTTVVTAFTDGFIQPLIAVITGGDADSVGGTFKVNGQTFDYGAFLASLINFVLVAAVLYFLVVAPLNALAERRKAKAGEEPEDPSNEEKIVALLEQIANKQ